MTDSTPTTLLDLDAVIEAHSSDGHATMPECVKCSEDASGEYAPWPCGTARLVDEVKNLRASLHLSMSTLKDACDVLFEASGLDAKYESETDLIHETVIGLRTERDAAIARAEAAEARYPCDELCVECPEETCSQHGRAPADIWRIVNEIGKERDEALAKVAAESWACWDQGHQATCESPDGCQEHGNPYPFPFRAVLTEVQAGAGDTCPHQGGKPLNCALCAGVSS